MSLAVVLDIVDGSRAEYSLSNGWTFTRIAKVTGVTGDGNARLASAIEATGMPSLGASHPVKAVAKLQKMSCAGESGEIYEVELYYAQRFGGSESTYPALGEPPVVEVGSSLSQVESNLDYQGNIISVSYTYPNDYYDSRFAPGGVGKTLTQSVPVARLAPEGSLVFRLTELYSPESMIETYQGKLNSQEWRGKAEKTWLCSEISGFTSDLGASYKNRYVFQYRSDGWDTRVVFNSPDTGRPPHDLVEDTGTKLVQIAGTADFNLLFLL
jgi:hypothetical protein